MCAIAIALMVGIAIGYTWLIPIVVPLVIAAICLITAIILRKTHFFTALVAVFFIALGVLLTTHKLHQTDILLTGQDGIYEFCLTDYPVVKGRSVRVETEIIHDGEKRRVMLSMNNDSLARQLILGDIIVVRGELKQPKVLNPGGFDYGKYLRMQGYSASIYATSWTKIGYQELHSIRAWGRKQQKKVVDYYLRCGFTQPQLGVLCALTIGERDLLEPDIREAFSKAGAMHVLAVSGLHVGIIYLLLLSLFTLFGYFKPLRKQQGKAFLQSFGIIGALWVYAVITGLSPSVVRASLMFSFGEIGRCLHRTNFGLNIVGASAVVTLIINPLALFSISFQLSYCAVISIITIGQKLDSWAISGLRFKKEDSKFNIWLKRVAQYIVGLLTISVAAQLGTLPLTLYYFNQFSVFFWLTNLFVLPFAEFFAFYSLLFLPFLPTVPQWVYGLLCDYVSWIEMLPHSTINIWINVGQMFLLFGIIIASYKQKWHYAAAVLALGYFAYDVHLQHCNSNVSELIIYADHKADVIQIIDRGSNTLFTNDSVRALELSRPLTQEYRLESPQLRAIERGLDVEGIGTIIFLTDTALQGNQLTSVPDCHLLVLGDIGAVGAERVLANFRADEIVLLGSMSSWKRKQIKTLCEQNNIRCKDVYADGACVYSFRNER